jgi:type IV secretion system protein VirD4
VSNRMRTAPDRRGRPGAASRPVIAVGRQVKEPGPLAQWANRTAMRAGHAGRWYFAAGGAGLAASCATGQWELFWVDAGMCLGVAGKNAIDGSALFRRGGSGKAARKRRRKYQGAATALELRRKLSVQAARQHAMRVGLDPDSAPVVLGTTTHRPRQVVAGGRGDSYLAVAPPQTMKTGLISCWVEDAPGACVAFSTRADQYRHTALSRGQRGEVLVLNADRLEGVPQSFFWSPVSGCEDPGTAFRRAGDFMAAAPRDPGGKDKWHEERGSRLLRYMLHAAALSGGSMRDVVRWVSSPADCPEPMAILQARNPEWAAHLSVIRESDGDFYNSIVSSAESALSWMQDPYMASIACPPPGAGTDIEQFIEDGDGTVYIIGEEREFGSASPFFAAVVAETFAMGRRVAERQGGRLRKGLTLAIDEAATGCPCPLPRWSSVAAGYNITLMAGIQALSQLKARWGEDDGRTVFNNFTVKMFGSGFTLGEDLEAISLVCGEHDVEEAVRHPDGTRTKATERVRLYPPERLRLMAPWHALVIHRNTRPAEVVVTPVWDRPGYRKLPEHPAYRTTPPAQSGGAVAPVVPIRPGPSQVVTVGPEAVLHLQEEAPCL